ncbi:serine/threonine protein phosphatase 2B catalytic subunit gamma isoform, putative [Entamoeba invadens IP1]|uniref:Serine/threonine-protein phosphatase n=1 Tax=Entamoeba invadens IP1 TaxID=370355 RepID=A0A0A1U3S9_ENTIV|nr:serine/threonine protein phosphatase 2B catalytic subunit gamma isoform, putative [Entamoeba invadens IP1]ELP88879.1 serine/threonine protein phosphatase 2B catalytic subunit gamma isoform, putative [Entamoeba invadens IP1]|eukprot:XP_004255650.1 serine/threonine protein phosphatase 2B catalytic subunit gamma isoform, putative [Entamoeba invadens IP1]
MSLTKPSMDLALVDGKYDIISIRNHFMNGGVLSIQSAVTLIQRVRQLLQNEPNLISVNGDVLIFGDFHGQFFDFLTEIEDFEWNRTPHKTIFLGDYVDRGIYSCELLFMLMSMKYNSPTEVLMLRGNHETRKMTVKWGFHNECIWKYNNEIYNEIMTVFDALPLAVIVSSTYGDFFLSHGGLSKSMTRVEEISRINRFKEPPKEGLFCDLLWSDPVSVEYFEMHPEMVEHWEEITYVENIVRNCSYMYGHKAVTSFQLNNKITSVIRGHQYTEKGIQMHFFGEEQVGTPLVFTLFSAPNYSKGNLGAGMIIKRNGIQVRTYTSSKLKEVYRPTLVNAFRVTTQCITMALNNFITDFIYYTFQGHFDLQDDDKLNVTSLVNSVNGRGKSVLSKRGKNIGGSTPMKRKRLFASSSSATEHKNTKKRGTLVSSIATEVPSKYEPTKIREETLPMSLTELRKTWTETETAQQ